MARRQPRATFQSQARECKDELSWPPSPEHRAPQMAQGGQHFLEPLDHPTLSRGRVLTEGDQDPRWPGRRWRGQLIPTEPPSAHSCVLAREGRRTALVRAAEPLPRPP